RPGRRRAETSRDHLGGDTMRLRGPTSRRQIHLGLQRLAEADERDARLFCECAEPLLRIAHGLPRLARMRNTDHRELCAVAPAEGAHLGEHRLGDAPGFLPRGIARLVQYRRIAIRVRLADEGELGELARELVAARMVGDL